MSIAIGPEYNAQKKVGEYLFTENVNENGGFLRFPYPYQAFFTITYKLSLDAVLGAKLDGQWNYEIRYIKNPDAGQMNAALIGNQTIEAKKR